METVEEPLMNHGFIIMQPIYEGCLITRIIDIESEKEIFSSSLELPKLNDPQKVGSAITYFRRYTLQSLLGINAHDDDGNRAAKKETVSKCVIESATNAINECNTLADLQLIWTNNKELQKEKFFIDAKNNRKQILEQNGISN
jgi:hypothetical protein